MIHIYSHKNSKRLQYILKIIFKELMGIDYSFTSSQDEFVKKQGVKLQYTFKKASTGDLFVESKNLLFETGIGNQDIQFVDYMDISCPFPSYSKDSLLPFDIFTASFYLISRYEEYLPHKKDMHHRFVAAESLAFQKNFLHLPVINIWAKDLERKIKEVYPDFKTNPPQFLHIPTYDIDIAWSYKNKGLTRSVGGSIRDLLRFDFEGFYCRMKVLFGQQKDPYDTFDLQKKWQKEQQLKSIYFILYGELGPFDKNTSKNNSEFQTLIKDLRDYAKVGIHPSYASNSNVKQLKREIEDLSDTVHFDIIRSRQHYLKLNLPSTYRNLLNLGIKHDYSMGFASQIGFRASIAHSFFFYDLDLDTETQLRIHPFAIMDGTLKDYLKLDAKTAKQNISEMIKQIKVVDGLFISLWHNESFSDMGKWEDWVDVYEHLLKEVKE